MNKIVTLWKIEGYANVFNSYSAGIDFGRQILTSKFDPRAVRVQIFLMAVEP